MWLLLLQPILAGYQVRPPNSIDYVSNRLSLLQNEVDEIRTQLSQINSDVSWIKSRLMGINGTNDLVHLMFKQQTVRQPNSTEYP